MASLEAQKLYDLVLVTDATGSMSSYLAALRTSLPQILSLSRLAGVFEDIAVLAYRDYASPNEKTIEWSGWLSSGEVDLPKFASSLDATGGGDYPEAVKTAIYELSSHLHEGRKTLVIWYTDAPPHHVGTRSSGGCREKEIEYLSSKGEQGTICLDWVSACRLLAKLECQVVTILATHFKQYDSFYAILGYMTKGGVLNCGNVLADSSRLISQLTVDFLLGWMGVKSAVKGRDDEGEANAGDLALAPCKTVTFRPEDAALVERMKDENSQCEGILPQAENQEAEVQVVYKNIKPSILTLAEGMLHHHTPVRDLSKQFVAEESYKKVVYRELKSLIEADVTAISLNSVFGDLWRVVCKQRQDDERTELVNAFSKAIAHQLQTPESKEVMTKWLEESYDQVGEINEMLGNVEEPDRFPAVCIDPTMCGDEILNWKRDELMEIGRSCQPAVLQRLGKVLNKLVYLPSKEEVPRHIANDDNVAKLPLSFAEKKYGRKFWALLLHLVMPGTLLGARPGALLAALTLRVEVPFLRTQARECLRAWKGRWADLEVGENWSMGCLRLLTRVDKMDRSRPGSSTDDGSSEEDTNEDESRGILTKFERSLFRKLYNYWLTDRNLGTELTAKVPFTPNKAYGYLATTALCKVCNVDRSVTMMSSGNVCGICFHPVEDPAEHKERVSTRTDTSEGETSKACWVECSSGTCRSQYVVYNVERLNVRAKCWYCRQDGKEGAAPWIECSVCTNRVIWPKEYRTAVEEGTFLKEPFKCSFCKEGRSTIVEQKVTGKELLAENSRTWILGEKGAPLDVLLTGRSMYNVVKTLSMEVMETVEVLPKSDTTKLVYKCKPVLNSDDVKEQFRSWVSKGMVESGTCTLCFENKFRKADLLPACGRRGCRHLVDAECMKGWYGMNRPGAVLNIMALHCPFCRRAPAGRTLEKYGMGVSALGGLSEAVSEQGQWIFGWCQQCGFARKVVERVCANGADPLDLKDWKCETCISTVMINAKECPGCGTMTQRSAGCNHITCPVATCGADWCFVCRYRGELPNPSGAVYDHMSDVHGGYFGADAEHQDDTTDEDYVSD